MMHMNGFTMGFFFPRQIEARPSLEFRKESLATPERETLPTRDSERETVSLPAPLGMIAYRFF